jgi:glycine oxidase
VRPLQGQMLRYEADVQIQRAVYGAGVYLVPRGRAVLAGATSDDVGFDVRLTPAARKFLDSGAKALLPGLHQIEPVDQWAGLRPMTADSLPLLGKDPEYPSLIYACGHSRNGILKAPLSGDCIAALFLGEEPPVPLTAFDPARFAAAQSPISPEE